MAWRLLARTGAVVFAAAATAVLAACASGTEPAGPEQTTSSTSTFTAVSSTTTEPSPQAQAERVALAVYEAMWQAMAAASATGDYQSPALPEHADGEALRVLVEGVYVSQREGIVAKGQLRTDPRVIAVEPAAAPTAVTIDDCIDSRDWLQHWAETGELVDDTPGGFRLTTAEVTLGAEGWKVTELLVGGIGTC